MRTLTLFYSLSAFLLSLPVTAVPAGPAPAALVQALVRHQQLQQQHKQEQQQRPPIYGHHVDALPVPPLVPASHVPVVPLPEEDTPTGQTYDTCANLDSAHLLIPSLSDPSKKSSYGPLSACLCLSTLPSYSLFSRPLRHAISTHGHARTLSSLRTLIASDHSAQRCTYGPGQIADCVRSSVCAWRCAEGWTQCGDTCVLGSSCPSVSPPPDSPVPACPKSHIACPLPPSSPEAVESGTADAPDGISAAGTPFICVNPMTNPHFCGGCPSPSPVGSISISQAASNPVGMVCADGGGIRGAVEATCESGRCRVGKCKQGWDVAPDGEGCVRRYTLRKGMVRLGRKDGD